MKRPLNYRPKFSLSLKYLEMFLSKKELKVLIDRYVEVKVANWNKKIRGK